uniref:Uncharacterized protein n=1 Tax=Quercus lobata TaxID=97700 RepID=A0A7N2L3V5_QUELO
MEAAADDNADKDNRSRPDLGRVGADFSRVGPIRELPRGGTRHGRAVCGVPPASPRPAASDAGALGWMPRPCIPEQNRRVQAVGCIVY